MNQLTTSDLDEITEICKLVIAEALARAQADVRTNPAEALRPVEVPRSGGEPKPAYAVDVKTEDYARALLHSSLTRYDPAIYGEERGDEEFGDLPLTEDLDLSGSDRLVFLLDMVDGTDLLAHGLSNWCAAMAVFHPTEPDPAQRIVATFVGLPDEAVYYARRDVVEPRKFIFNSDANGNDVCLTGPSERKRLAEASVAFYGQKAGRLLGLFQRPSFVQKLSEGGLDKLRIYNLAGNPFMVRLVDKVAGSKRIDAVFDIGGQYPHDAVPGLYIAMKAGAALLELSGESSSELGAAKLAECLMKPADKSNRLAYILANTTELAQEVGTWLGYR